MSYTNTDVSIRVGSDTTRLVRTLRIIAKHAQACADELDAERIAEDS
ncbi:MAG TPA: hypothetical protein VGB14_00360 [Acidimicrobiales bacterium]